MTASGTGIGYAIAERLMSEGCEVLVRGRDPARTGDAAGRLRAGGGTVETVLGDLTDDAAARAVAERARDWGADVLVNNAGPFAEHDLEAAEPAAWLTSMDANVVSAVRLIQVLAPAMRERGWGRIVNVGSRAATTRCRT